MNDNQCPICFGDFNANFNNPSHTTSCGHTFHKKCIDTWFAVKPTCPICRTRRVAVADCKGRGIALIERLETLLSAVGTPPESIEPLLDALINLASTDLSTVRDVRRFNDRKCSCLCYGGDRVWCYRCKIGITPGVAISAELQRAVIARLRAMGVPLSIVDIEWLMYGPRVDDRDDDGMNAYVLGLYFHLM